MGARLAGGRAGSAGGRSSTPAPPRTTAPLKPREAIQARGGCPAAREPAESQLVSRRVVRGQRLRVPPRGKRGPGPALPTTNSTLPAVEPYNIEWGRTAVPPLRHGVRRRSWRLGPCRSKSADFVTWQRKIAFLKWAVLAAVSECLAVFAGGKTAMAHDLGPPRAVLSTF